MALLDPMFILVLILGGTSIKFSIIIVCSNLPSCQQCTIFSLHPHALLSVVFFYAHHSKQYDVISYCDFDLHSPNDNAWRKK